MAMVVADKDKVQIRLIDYQLAARYLGLKELAPLRAVIQVEAAGKAFYDSGPVPILFEAHIFDELTGGRFRRSHPNLSRRKWTRGLYKGGLAEYTRLDAAQKLDRRAALMACSWGAPQILGRNYRMCGFDDVEPFVKAMQESAGAQMQALARFIKSARLDDELQRHDWRGFAKGYNGPAYAKHDYDGRLARAYAKFAAKRELIEAVESPAADDDDVAQQLADSRWYIEPAAEVALPTVARSMAQAPLVAAPARSLSFRARLTAALASLLTALAAWWQQVDWMLVMGVLLITGALFALFWHEGWLRQPQTEE